MTRKKGRIRAWLTDAVREPDDPGGGTDPTHRAAAVSGNGVPLVHEGPPGYPGRSLAPDDPEPRRLREPRRRR